MVAALLINYGFSFLTARKSKAALILSSIINACLLMGFKILAAVGYTVHLPDNRDLTILLPLGISFYTFKLIS